MLPSSKYMMRRVTDAKYHDRSKYDVFIDGSYVMVTKRGKSKVIKTYLDHGNFDYYKVVCPRLTIKNMDYSDHKRCLYLIKDKRYCDISKYHISRFGSIIIAEEIATEKLEIVGNDFCFKREKLCCTCHKMYPLLEFGSKIEVTCSKCLEKYPPEKPIVLSKLTEEDLESMKIFCCECHLTMPLSNFLSASEIGVNAFPPDKTLWKICIPCYKKVKMDYEREQRRKRK